VELKIKKLEKLCIFILLIPLVISFLERDSMAKFSRECITTRIRKNPEKKLQSRRSTYLVLETLEMMKWTISKKAFNQRLISLKRLMSNWEEILIWSK
jgi:hypothetical protein